MQMKQKKHIVFPLRNMLMTLSSLLVGAMGLYTAIHEPVDDAWVGYIMAVLFFFAGIFMFICFPFAYIFDCVGVKICYVGCYEYAKWEDIRKIFTMSWASGSMLMVYCISPITPQKKHRFYMKGEINKSLLTRKYINLYWNGFIDGKPTKKKGFVPPNSDSITVMERDAKKNIREMLDSFKPAFSEYGIFLKASFFPKTADRPLEDYVFECEIEIGDMTDEERRRYLSVPLIEVCCRKKGYEGKIVDGGTVAPEGKLNAILKALKNHGKKIFFEEICADFEE